MDIVEQLRDRSLVAEQEGEPLALLDDAADEIARLRLTDAEDAAIRFALGRLSGTLRGNEECDHYDALARLLTK
jgi:hypothetical protein